MYICTYSPLCVAVCVVVCVLVPSMPAMTLFPLALASTATCGALVACFNGGLFAVLGTFPGSITQAGVAGQGLAGLLVSVVSLVTIALGTQDDSFCSEEEEEEEEGGGDAEECNEEVDYSALAFFATCCAVVLVAIACYCILENLPSTM
jgi:hypothetical protein